MAVGSSGPCSSPWSACPPSCALLTFAGARRAYGEIGRGLLSLRDGTDRPLREPVLSGSVARAEQEEELRQMLGARNAVRARAGRPLLDVEAELARLTGAGDLPDPRAARPRCATS